MTFKHKLSQRLALLRDVMLLGLVLAVACERLGPTTTGGSVSWVDVVPATVTVTPGQAFPLTATPKDANGNPLPGRAIAWSSSAPAVATVGSSGFVTGVAVGASTITAMSDGKSGTAVVTVTVAPPPPPPGATEPVFNPAADVSLFYDDYEAYGSTADLTSGPNAKYVSLIGKVALVRAPGGDYAGGAQFARFNYSGGSGAEDNEIHTNQHRSPLLDTASVVILTYGYRNSGTFYNEKQFIIRDLTGANRFVLLGAAYFITPQSLQNCWYSPVYPYPPLFAYVQPRGQADSWSRDGLGSVGGPVPHFLDGQIGYPTAQFMNAGTQVGPKNDGNWHRFTYRFTRERAGGGTGRLEGWFDGVKVMEYIGDDPSRCDYRQVWTWGATNTIWTNDMYWVGTTSGGGGLPGPAIIDMDAVRLWLP